MSDKRRPPSAPYRGPRCPTDPSHGTLLDWPSARASFFCPNQAHDGFKDRPRTRPFFTVAEAEGRVA